MTTFEEFVSVVHTQLLKRYPDSNATLTKVQQVLSERDIDNALQQETLMAPPKRLQLRRLQISGHKHKPRSISNETAPFVYDRHLGQGINGWIAGNGTGKSTILKAIVWGLTGVEQHFKQDIRSWIEDVSLEIAIANSIYTIRYFPRNEQPGITGMIVEQDIDTMLENKAIPRTITTFSGTAEMMQNIDTFFCERLSFTPFQLDQVDAISSADAPPKISWQIYSQALFIGSNYTDYLFPKNGLPGKPHQKTLSTYLGLGSTDIVAKLEVERDKARENYKFEVRRMAVNSHEVQKKINDLQTELRFVDGRIQSIDEGQSVLVDPAYLSEVQAKIAQHTARIVDLSTTEQQLFKEEREMQKKIDDLQSACQALREEIQFRVFFSGLTIERCPNCEKELEAERIEEEVHNKQCRLCHSELRPVQSVEQYEILLDETQETIKKLGHDLKTIKKDLNKAISMHREEENRRVHWRNELQDLPRQERTGFTQEIRDLIDKRGNLNGQLIQLQEQTAEGHSERLKDLKDTHEILEAALTETQALIWLQYATHWNSLETRTTELAKLFGITDLERISFRFGESFDLFVKQGGRFNRYRNMEASEMLRLKLAFHLAMLVEGTTNGIGRHPGLLIVDAPGGAEMDEQHLQHILKGFSDIRHQIGSEMQVLIASTKERIASICEPANLEQPLENSTLF